MLVASGFRILSIQSRPESKLNEVICERIGSGLQGSGKAWIYPGKISVKIKGIDASGRNFRLRIKEAKRSVLIGGAIIVSPKWPIEESREILLLSDNQGIPEGNPVVQGGSYLDFNREGIIGPGSFYPRFPFVTARFPAPYPAFPGAQLSVRGRDKEPRRLTVLWPGRLETRELRRLGRITKNLLGSHPHVFEIYRCILHLRGYVKMAPCIGRGPFPDEVSSVASWLVLKDKLEDLRRKILKIASKPGGANAKMMRVEGFPDALILAIAQKMCGAMELRFSNGWFFKPGCLSLSPLHRVWLKRVQEAGTEGVRVGALAGAAERTILNELSRIGLVRGGRRLWFSIEASEALSAMLLEGKNRGDRISMSYARKILFGSRSRTLELLHIMESERRLSALSGGGERTVCQ